MQNKTTQRARGYKKVVEGKVISSKGNQAISVRTQSFTKHPKYKKYIRRHSLFIAHDEKNQAKTGDTVQIVATRPLSKTKRWRLINVVQSNKEVS